MMVLARDKHRGGSKNHRRANTFPPHLKVPDASISCLSISICVLWSRKLFQTMLKGFKSAHPTRIAFCQLLRHIKWQKTPPPRNLYASLQTRTMSIIALCCAEFMIKEISTEITREKSENNCCRRGKARRVHPRISRPWLSSQSPASGAIRKCYTEESTRA